MIGIASLAAAVVLAVTLPAMNGIKPQNNNLKAVDSDDSHSLAGFSGMNTVDPSEITAAPADNPAAAVTADPSAADATDPSGDSHAPDPDPGISQTPSPDPATTPEPNQDPDESPAPEATQTPTPAPSQTANMPRPTPTATITPDPTPAPATPAAQQTTIMPDLRNRTEVESIAILKDNNLRYELKAEYSNSVSEGSVISQSVPSGREVAFDSVITITVSLGQSSEDQLKSMKITKGITVGRDPSDGKLTLSMFKDELPAGLPDVMKVVLCSTDIFSEETIPDDVAKFKKDRWISFTFDGRSGPYYHWSNNNKYTVAYLFDTAMNFLGYCVCLNPSAEVLYDIPIPEVTGISLKSAIDILAKAGFTYEIALSDDYQGASDLVRKQYPTSGMKVNTKCKVTLYLSVSADILQLLNNSGGSALLTPVTQPDGPLYNRNAVQINTQPTHVRTDADDIRVLSVKTDRELKDGDEPTIVVVLEYNLVSEAGANIVICVNNGDDSKGNLENTSLYVPKGRGTFAVPFTARAKYWDDGSGVMVNAYLRKTNGATLTVSNSVTLPIEP